MSPALQDGLAIGARRDPLETEADWIADRIAGAPAGSRGWVQRASPALAGSSTTEGQLEPAPEQPPPSTGLGLDQPDCGTRVTDVFWLGPTYEDPARPECGFAEIHLLEDISQYGYVRADFPLPGTPCKSGDTRKHGVWLRHGSNEWRVLEIRHGGIDVMNACGDEETLGMAGSPKPAPGPPPETSVEVEDGNFGAGTVETWNGGKRVVFTPRTAGETREYELEVRTQRGVPGDMKVYVPVKGEKIPYAPSDLASMLRVHLLGDKNGEPLPPPPVEPEQLPGTFSD